MKKIIFLWASFIFFALQSPLSHSAGVNLHIFMADKAIETIKDATFRKFLTDHQDALRTGAIFPDSGYLKRGGDSYGEFAHWDKFHNGYATYLDQNCSLPLSDSCANLFAFFLGTMSHGVSDVTWHRDFITEVSKRDFNGNYSMAHTYSDLGLEMLAIIEYHRGLITPKFYYPVDELVKIFELGGMKVERSEISYYTKLGYGVLLVERLEAPFSYLYNKLKVKWAPANYYDAKGGVQDSALAISQLWVKVWNRIVSEQRFNGVANFRLKQLGGGWPYVDLYLE